MISVLIVGDNNKAEKKKIFVSESIFGYFISKHLMKYTIIGTKTKKFIILKLSGWNPIFKNKEKKIYNMGEFLFVNSSSIPNFL